MLRSAFQIGVLSVFLYLAVRFYVRHSFNPHYKKHHPGDCRQVKGIDFGSEDFEVTEDGLAFITSGVDFPAMPDALHEFVKQKLGHGRIYLFDFKRPELEARNLKIRASKNFDLDTFLPHGISLLEDKVKGEHVLYVINHPRGGKDRVEKFRYIPKVNELEHIRFFTSSHFTIMNDLAVVSEDKFYITKYLALENPILGRLEKKFALPLGGIFYVDKDDVTEVVHGLAGANGATLSKDQKYLYVAVFLSVTLQVYERQQDNSLKLIQDATDINENVDNLHITFSGDALLGGVHPIDHKIEAFINNPDLESPSSVVRIPLKKGRVVIEEMTELFYDHGDLISGSTGAHIHSDQLLIGSVLHKLAVCDLYTKPAAQKAG